MATEVATWGTVEAFGRRAAAPNAIARDARFAAPTGSWSAPPGAFARQLRFLGLTQNGMAKGTLSIFVDESGIFKYPDTLSRFYLLSLVLHDQSQDISRPLSDLSRGVADLGFDPDDFVFHAGPIIRKEDGYNLYYGLLKGTPYKWLDPIDCEIVQLWKYENMEI